MTQPPPSASVERVDGEQLYQILVDGQRVGVAIYRDRGDQRIFVHTEVDDAFAGQGLAGRLVWHALTDARNSGMRIVPVCPYVAKYLERHREFADDTDPASPEILQWLDRN